ncbi:molybdenum cofactor guanylyltransferase [Desulfolithobacter dissulfuricans]|uniref:Molybdenum cofactor guanylyltransferase n=1 Tax=Desulfolithobacter dissulfuricans TaxID=2795293 RepID=A0A915U1W6_9BACT|nr:molybdopterin-guanine dinucleotide biosynthesis protein B [Desulfolithobacter dissulfuricans]BCO09839.1 molybdenum cofactor guanylyltransferase [Desulfolithobacter dissulfuricans]
MSVLQTDDRRRQNNVGMSLDQLPVLGICGSSGSGKTTLIEALIPSLLARGLQLVVLKHDAIKVQVDRPGKDSDRFFQAGADVWVLGDLSFCRIHSAGDLHGLLRRLCLRYDLVLVEGHGTTEVPKLWLSGETGAPPARNRGRILETLDREQATPERVLKWIDGWLASQWRRPPVWGCVLIGGRSSRMGQPKHLIKKDGATWVERTVWLLEKCVDQVVISGRGDLPQSLAHLPRIPDAPGLAGPLAGVLSVLRWQPAVSWLITACDQPAIRPEALQWLLDQRCPGTRAILPDLEQDGRVEPLLALYDFRCRPLLEELALGGSLRISMLAGVPGIVTPSPPPALHSCWRNVNTPDELKGLS